MDSGVDLTQNKPRSAEELIHYIQKVVLSIKFNISGDYCRVPIAPGYNCKVSTERLGIRCIGDLGEIGVDTISVISTPFEQCLKRFNKPEVEVSYTYIDDFYYFTAEIVDMKGNGVVVIAKPLQVKQTQRRQNVRYFTQIPVIITKIDDKSCYLNGKDIVTKDISAGGIKLVRDLKTCGKAGIKALSEDESATASNLGLSFTLPGSQQSIEVDADVKWISRVKNTYEYGIMFNNISTPDQDSIVRFIYEKALEDRRKSKERDSVIQR